VGVNFNTFISKKTTLVPGDISREDLGIEDTILREEIYDQTDVIINLAATTNFDERYSIYTYKYTYINSKSSYICLMFLLSHLKYHL